MRSLRKLGLYVEMLRYGSAHNEDFAREHWEFFVLLRDEVQSYFADLSRLRILDVGCGKSFWLTLLLHSAGARVTGVDTEVVARGPSPTKYWALLRRNGLERVLRTLVWEVVFARPYYRALSGQCPFPLRFDGVDLRSASAERLPFEDGTFDLAVSHEVFEHLPDVPAALRELRRTLTPQGMVCLYIHNYASLSGGHHVAWKYPDAEPSVVVPPWDHLRGNFFPEIPSWINRLREGDYREAFEQEFEVLTWTRMGIEGERLLTPEIRCELADFPEAELLTKGFLVTARPKRGAS